MTTNLQPTIAPPPGDSVPYPVCRFTVAQFQAMVAAGVLEQTDRLELLHGWITPKMISHNPPHDSAIDLAAEALLKRLPAGLRLRIQSAITTSDSQPEPDLAVVRGSARDYATRHPGRGEVIMVVEVADSSLQRDRQKAAIYAAAGVPVYWIVNLQERTVEAYSEPTGPAGYARLRSFAGGDLVTIEAEVFTEPIPVADLLP